MGTIRKIGNEYYIEFYARGLLYQQKAGSDQSLAQQRLKEIEAKIQQGEMDCIVRDVEVDIFFNNFLESIRQKYSTVTVGRYAATILHFSAFCSSCFEGGGIKLSRITPSVIERYRVCLLKSDAGIRPKTVNFTLYLLKHILEHAIKQGYLNDNPALHVKLIEPAQLRVPRRLLNEEALQLRAGAGARLRDVIDMALGAGLRLTELIRLTWSGVDFPNNCITIDQSSGSGCPTRRIPLDADIRALLDQLWHEDVCNDQCVLVDPEGQMWQRDLIERQFYKAVGRSGLSDQIRLCSLRDTFAFRVLQRGVSLIGLSRLLGLTDVAKVMRYAGYVPETKMI